MNKKLLSLAGIATAFAFQCLPVAANQIPSTVTGGASPGVVIPDNSLNGVSSTVELYPTFSSIIDVTVTVDITGAPYAYDGDYYAYLEYGSTLVTLMDNPGADQTNPWGSPNNGMDVTFTEAALQSINSATAPNFGPLSGSYLPQSSLAAFNGVLPVSGYNRLWTLYIADTSPGGVGQLNSWSLSVTGVPDNGNSLWLLGLSGGLLGLTSLRHRRLALVKTK